MKIVANAGGQSTNILYTGSKCVKKWVGGIGLGPITSTLTSLDME